MYFFIIMSCILQASTEEGTVYGIDARQETPLWTLKAHTSACTGKTI